MRWECRVGSEEAPPNQALRIVLRRSMYASSHLTYIYNLCHATSPKTTTNDDDCSSQIPLSNATGIPATGISSRNEPPFRLRGQHFPHSFRYDETPGYFFSLSYLSTAHIFLAFAGNSTTNVSRGAEASALYRHVFGMVIRQILMLQSEWILWKTMDHWPFLLQTQIQARVWILNPTYVLYDSSRHRRTRFFIFFVRLLTMLGHNQPVVFSVKLDLFIFWHVRAFYHRIESAALRGVGDERDPKVGELEDKRDAETRRMREWENASALVAHNLSLSQLPSLYREEEQPLFSLSDVPVIQTSELSQSDASHGEWTW